MENIGRTIIQESNDGLKRIFKGQNNKILKPGYGIVHNLFVFIRFYDIIISQPNFDRF